MASFPVTFIPPPNLMSISQRKHTRFSLDIPAAIVTRFGERQYTMLQQISVGGCFTDWEENIYAGDEFRLEIDLPNGNRLPLRCKAIYRFENTGIGVRFVEVSQFEQDLIGTIISDRMQKEGLPAFMDSFSNAPEMPDAEYAAPRVTDQRAAREEILEKIMSGE
jgi:hypothetical protein